ncbi:MAG: hypothetical protein EAZ58_03935 [Flavobacterium sp.]|nr:MAG: hypothetical protein EAZ58_03935 [Flavobacterium sp.]
MLTNSTCKIILFFFITVCFSNRVVAQVFSKEEMTYKEEVYLRVIHKNKNALETIENYYLLCKLFQKTDIDKSNHYADKLRWFSNKNKKNKGLVYFYLIKAYNDIYRGNYNEANLESKKAVFYLKNEFNINLYLEAIYFQVVANYFLGNYENSIKLACEAIKDFEKTNAFKQIGLLHNLVAANYSSLEKLHLSLNHLEKSTAFFIKAKDNKGLMSSYNQIADIYFRINLYFDALQYSNKAVSIAKKRVDVDTQSYTILLLFNAEINLAMRKLEMAKRNLSLVNFNLKSISNDGLTSTYFLLKAEYFMLNNNYTAALHLCNEAQKIEADYEFSKQKLQYKFAKCYHKLGNYKKAQTYFKQLDLELNKHNFKFIGIDIARFYYDFAQNEKLLENYKSAIDYLQRHSKWLNQKQNQGNEVKILFLLNKYDVSQKNLELKNNKLEKQKIQLLLKDSNDKIYFIIGVLCIAIILVIFIYFKYKRGMYYNNLLTEKSRIIEEKNQFIENSILKLESLLKTKEILLKEIHHRVKNNLQMVMSLLRSQARDSGNNINDFIDKTQARIVAIALIHQKLYQSENVDKVDMQEYLISLCQSILQSINDDESKISIKVDAQDVFLDISFAINIGLIINELVTNSVKYAYPSVSNGLINVSIKSITFSKYQLKVYDSGVGFDIQNYKEKSFGKELVSLLTEQIEGKLLFINNNGSEYTITFDINNHE